MTSPVDTSVKHFTSDMVNAPALTGQAGSLIALLDALLIDGFGLKSVSSLVVAGGIATLAISGGASAALVDSVILVAGATPSALNGEQKVLSAGPTSVTFATAVSDQAATGTITFKMAPAGWAKPFLGTNLAAYKSVDAAALGCFLRVDDTNTLFARLVGYETMSDVSTGTGPFPTAAQMSGGGYWHKSSVANATGNKWVLICDSRFFIFWSAPYSGANPLFRVGGTRGFGDFISYRPSGDAYACALNYSNTNSTQESYDNALDYSGNFSGNAVARSHSGLGASVLHGVYPFTGTLTGLSGNDSLLGPFPSPIDGGLRLSKRYYTSAASTAPRGELPGLYSVPQSGTLNSFFAGDRVPGTGLLAGRKLIALTVTRTTMGGTPDIASSGVSFVDITGPWR